MVKNQSAQLKGILKKTLIVIVLDRRHITVQGIVSKSPDLIILDFMLSDKGELLFVDVFPS